LDHPEEILRLPDIAEVEGALDRLDDPSFHRNMGE